MIAALSIIKVSYLIETFLKSETAPLAIYTVVFILAEPAVIVWLFQFSEGSETDWQIAPSWGTQHNWSREQRSIHQS